MEYVEKEEYVLLNFKDKIQQRLLANPNVFFKILNLETPNPLVQIGNQVFTSKFDNEILGTSLLFEEQEELLPEDIYNEETHIHLKYIAKTNKFLTLKLCKVPEEVLEIDPDELEDLEFRHSYETVIKQLEDGTLDINDIIKNGDGTRPEGVSDDESNDSRRSPLEAGVLNMEAELQAEANERKTAKVSEDDDYTLLKDLIYQQANDPEYYNQVPEDTFQTDKEYMILKEIYLKSLDYSKCSEKLKNLSVRQYVDLQGSIDAGIIEMKTTLNEEDNQKLFSMENFDNFSVNLKILVLTDYLKEEKESWKDKTRMELAQEDEFGRTPKKRYNMVKSLVNDMKYNVFMMSRESFQKEGDSD